MKKGHYHVCRCGQDHTEYLRQADAANFFLAQIGLKVELNKRDGNDLSVMAGGMESYLAPAVTEEFELSSIDDDELSIFILDTLKYKHKIKPDRSYNI